MTVAVTHAVIPERPAVRRGLSGLSGRTAVAELSAWSRLDYLKVITDPVFFVVPDGVQRGGLGLGELAPPRPIPALAQKPTKSSTSRANGSGIVFTRS